MATYNHSSDRPPNYVAVCRRPPHTTRRTATSVLAGNHGWLEYEDALILRTNRPPPDLDLSVSATPQLDEPSPSQNLLRDTNNENTPTGRRGATAAVPAKGGRGKGKAKTPAVVRPIDMGVSIIPICAPGTGTPSPSPEPPSPPPHPHLRRPPQSYASSSSSGVSSSITQTSAGGVTRRSDFDVGAQRAAGGVGGPAAATVGKRPRGPSQSQRTRLPISPPVTSPNTSQSELPPLYSTVLPQSAPANKPKRTREGREPVRRKRRKTETRGEAPVAAQELLGEHVDNAVRKQQAPSRAPTRRKGWKGWVMVSDTEGSDAERANTPSAKILEKKTRSGRDFDQDAPLRVNRRARSAMSVGTESVTTSTAPLSAITTTSHT